MTDAAHMAEARARVLAAGLAAGDLAWIDGLGWNPATVPAVKSEADFTAYKRREKALNGAIAHLTFAERGQSPEGKLAAAIGARLADWTDKAAGEDAD